MTQNKKAQMLPANSNVDIVGLKMVKNASIFSENGVIFIRHYSTIIFAYDPQKTKCEVTYDLSQTSNRQIQNAINFFGIDRDSIKDLSDGSKWKYSGERTN